MKEIDVKVRDKTIAIDFDGVIHRYSKGFKGQQNVYDKPTEGTREALEKLKSNGYRLVIVSCRPPEPIKKWLVEQDMLHYFDEISNTKLPAKCYIDDKAIRFERGKKSSWDYVLDFIDNSLNY